MNTMLSFALTILSIITIIRVLQAESDGDISSAPNPLATITEVTIRFIPAMAATEFICKTRYNVSGAHPLSLHYNDNEIHTVNDGDFLSHEMEDAEPGEYKFKIGADEFKFQLQNLIDVENLNIIEIVYHANLVTGRTQIQYESLDMSNVFLCDQNDIRMEEDYHDIIAGIESKGFNGTLEPKTKTSHKCHINKDQFEFSVINNVEDLYPRISSFQFHVLPKSHHDGDGFDFYVTCQTRTAKNPKILLFVNQYELVKTNFGNHAFYKSEYKKEAAFKCIVQNEYGRDVISWDGQHLTHDHIYPKDSFMYVVDADQQITKMIYKPAEHRHLHNVMCRVKEKNQFYQYKTVTNENKKRVFTETIEKYVQYSCKMAGKKEFNSSLYTKDWLYVPKIASAEFTVRLNHPDQLSSPYWLTIECNEAMKTAAYAIHLLDGYKTVNSSTNFYTGMMHGLYTHNYNNVNHLSTARCVIENDMGYDMVEVDYLRQIPKVSSVQFKFSTFLDDQTQSSLSYMRYYENMHETTNCSHDKGPESRVAYTTQYFFRREYHQDRGQYNCDSICPKREQSTCQNGRDLLQVAWKRMRTSYFPNGLSLIADPIYKYESFFGFYSKTS